MDKPITKTKRVTGAVLATVLATGMVPAAALAEPVDVQTDEGIEALVASNADMFTNGEVTAATDQVGTALDMSKPIKFIKGKTNIGIKPTTVTLAVSEKEVDVTNTNLYTVAYDKDVNGDGTPDGTAVAQGDLGNQSAGKYFAILRAVNYVGNGSNTAPEQPNLYNGGTINIPFEIVNASVEGAKLYNGKSNNTDPSKAFIYDGTAQESYIRFSVNGDVVNGDGQVWDPTRNSNAGDWVNDAENPAATTPKYAVKFYEGGTDTVITTFTNAGNYVANIRDHGAKDSEAVNIPFTIQPLDLSKADITLTTDNNKLIVSGITEGLYTCAPDSTHSGSDVTDIDKIAVALKDSQSAITASGSYPCVVTAPENSKNVIGSQELDYVKTTYAAKFAYGSGITANPGAASSDANGSMLAGATSPAPDFSVPLTVDLSAKTPTYFNTADLQVTYWDSGASPAAWKVVPASELTITVTDKDGNPATEADLKTAGTWKVTATVSDEALEEHEYLYGGSSTKTVNVINGTVGTANVYAMLDGEPLTVNASGNLPVEYTGKSVLNDLKIVVTDSKNKTLTEGTDYTIEWKDADGKVVTELVDRGVYTGKISSNTYTLGTGSDIVNVEITPVNVQALRMSNEAYRYTSEVSGATVYNVTVPYTGEAITPTVEYQNKDGEWAALPADEYKLTYAYNSAIAPVPTTFQPVKAMQEAGTYRVSLELAKDDSNYALNTSIYTASAPIDGKVYIFNGNTDKLQSGTSGNFTDLYTQDIVVSEKQLFADVPNGEWFTDPIYTACENGYMSGYLGTDLFGTNGNLTRAQACIVLYNMAGGQIYSQGLQDKEHSYYGYSAGYSDLDKEAYYMVAISWADSMGVIKGYPDGTFGPEDKVTREQFVTMMQRYANLLNKDTSVDAATVLAEYKDGAAVAEWFADPVAWAAENEIIGQGTDGYLWSSDIITRAQAAKMIVTYQPKPLPKPLVK